MQKLETVVLCKGERDDFDDEEEEEEDKGEEENGMRIFRRIVFTETD
jgi:hypothetical protein